MRTGAIAFTRRCCRLRHWWARSVVMPSSAALLAMEEGCGMPTDHFAMIEEMLMIEPPSVIAPAAA